MQTAGLSSPVLEKAVVHLQKCLDRLRNNTSL